MVAGDGTSLRLDEGRRREAVVPVGLKNVKFLVSSYAHAVLINRKSCNIALLTNDDK